MFKSNVGSADQVIRLALAAILIACTFIGPKTPWGLLGFIPLVTGLAGTCPLYSLIGLNTGVRK